MFICIADDVIKVSYVKLRQEEMILLISAVQGLVSMYESLAGMPGIHLQGTFARCVLPFQLTAPTMEIEPCLSQLTISNTSMSGTADNNWKPKGIKKERKIAT